MLTDNGYAYAKACGIIGKSFLGVRTSLLSALHTLNDMEKLVFPDNQKESEGGNLLAGLEKQITDRAARFLLSVIGSYSNPPEILACMLKSAEYKSPLSDDPIKQGKNLSEREARLDYQYYKNLIESLGLLSGDDRKITQKLLCEEISLRNCIWALRLRFYYEKNETDTAAYLMDFQIPGSGSQKKLSSDASASLNFHLDVPRQWDGWKREKFLNMEDSSHEAKHWSVDPRYFQNAVSRYLYHLALRGFHSEPVTISAIYCFVKLIQFEEDLLSSVAQGLALGIDGEGVLKMLGVSQSGREAS